MMEWFNFEWLSFFIVGLATLFLIGELLVNAKGIFAGLGLILMTVYFLAYLDPSMFLTMAVLYIVGILFIFIDGQFINDGSLAGIGAILMIISVGASSPNWVVGLYAVVGLIVGAVMSLFWIKVLPRRNMWSKITLLDQLTDDSGYSSMNRNYRKLLGETGITLTDMRPVGKIKINGEEYSAISNGHWISHDVKVVVKQVDGTRILVEIVD